MPTSGDMMLAGVRAHVEAAGLVYKGGMGDVHLFEHPAHPGLTMSARAAEMTDANAVMRLAESKVQAHVSKGGTSLDAIKSRLGMTSAPPPAPTPPAISLKTEMTEVSSNLGVRHTYVTTASDKSGWVGDVVYGHHPKHRPNTASIINSDLQPQLRGKGIGKQIYHEAIESAHQSGFRFFTSDAGGEVSQSARRMWASLERTHGARHTRLRGKDMWIIDLKKAKAAMKAGASEAQAGTGTISALVKGARKMGGHL